MITEFKRVKHGEMPGEVSRGAKIFMREKGTGFHYFPWFFISEKQSKALRRYLIDKSRTVQRRRDKRVINEELSIPDEYSPGL